MTRYLLIAGLLIIPVLFAQQKHRVDPYHSYHRVVGILPLIGSGTHDDPVRPKYAPARGNNGTAPGKGIIAFAFQLSDDGQHAIAELVAADRSALIPVLADHSAGVIIFERGAVSQATIESAIRQYRKTFSLNGFGVAIQ